MILAAALLLGVLIGWLVGGRLRNLENMVVAHAGVIIGLFVAQALLRGRSTALAWLPGSVRIGLWCCCTLVLLVLAVANHRLPGFLLLSLGLGLNLAVVAANGGMPLSGEAAVSVGASSGALSSGLDSGFYQLVSPLTRLALLGDVIPLRPPWSGTGVVLSIGDVVMLGGMVVAVAGGMRMTAALTITDTE